jgi:adenosylmethionine---8-amino-7-oxononanoate aminotransferase
MLVPSFPMPPDHWDTDKLSMLDKRHVWHPFTPMADWMAADHEPLFLVRGEGVWLWDSRGRRYLDGNSSIWTNVHGHGHPKLVATIARQAATVCHTSFLGFSNPWATELAARLAGYFPGTPLQRVFFTDDGSTAIECAVKMAIQCRQLRGECERVGFGAFANAYHGDTLGAASLGGVSAFVERFSRWGLQPRRFAGMEDLRKLDDAGARSLCAVVVEPMIQGVNRMALWPPGMLRELRAWCDNHGVFLILDEVMTGFGRTGKMFACQHEDVTPDFLCLAKGLSGGTMPLAATMVSDKVFEAFVGPSNEGRVFYYGHSYCGNPLASAAALASLDIFEEEKTLENMPAKEACFDAALSGLKLRFPQHVAAIRRIGLVAGIDIVAAPGQPFDPELAMGARVCQAAREFGLLTRPVLDTLVLMPPLCISPEEIDFMVQALGNGLAASLP